MKSNTKIDPYDDLEIFYEFIQTNNFKKAKNFIDNY